MPLFLILIQDKPVKPGEELAVSSSGEDEAGPEEGTGVFSSGIVSCRGRDGSHAGIHFGLALGRGAGCPSREEPSGAASGAASGATPAEEKARMLAEIVFCGFSVQRLRTVSYTHLTLPTIYSV